MSVTTAVRASGASASSASSGQSLLSRTPGKRSSVANAERGSTTRVSLKAAGYPGGALGWEDFDLDQAASKGLDRNLPESGRHWLIPGHISYSGMPAKRFWNFEDGEVYSLHFFFAERHTTQSNFRVETTLQLRDISVPTVSALHD